MWEEQRTLPYSITDGQPCLDTQASSACSYKKPQRTSCLSDDRVHGFVWSETIAKNDSQVLDRDLAYKRYNETAQVTTIVRTLPPHALQYIMLILFTPIVDSQEAALKPAAVLHVTHRCKILDVVSEHKTVDINSTHDIVLKYCIKRVQSKRPV